MKSAKICYLISEQSSSVALTDPIPKKVGAAFEGAYERFGKPLPAEVKERLKAELKIINRNGYPAYFLMWHEIIAAAHELGAQVGPGRGSAACSLVLYCLGITQVNPLRFGLEFGGFFNIEHALPRIEVEFDKLGRERVLKWIVERYGEERVANIVAPNYFTSNTITAELPQVPKLVWVVRKMDIHSCGVAICAEDISERIPLAFVESAEYENAVVVTQYGAEQLKRMGVEVLHILSSNTLDIIASCASRVECDIENIPLDDVKTLNLFRQGGVEGVFRAAANEAQPLTFDRLVDIYSRHCSNRAHALCATLLAYRLAYLRAHYPAEYAEACNKR